METVLSVFLGIGLAAACGFRIFVPMLAMSVAARTGHLALSPGFEWIGTWPATILFGAAMALEIAAYYVPWVDNMLDLIATPAAVAAGIIVMASCASGLSPMLRWTLAVLAGGGAAGIVQGATVVARAASTATTGGLGNPAVSSVEAAGSIAVSILSIALPLVAGIVVIGGLVLAVRKLRARRARAGAV